MDLSAAVVPSTVKPFDTVPEKLAAGIQSAKEQGASDGDAKLAAIAATLAGEAEKQVQQGPTPEAAASAAEEQVADAGASSTDTDIATAAVEAALQPGTTKDEAFVEARQAAWGS